MEKEDQKAVRRQPLYDSNVVVNGFLGDLTFFATPVGQADNALVVKTISESNNTFAGQLPRGEWMDVDGITVTIGTNNVNANVVIADIQNILENSRTYLQFRIDRTTWFEAPLFKFTSGHGIVVSGVNAAADSWTNGAPAPRAVISFPKNVVRIPEGRPFDVVVRVGGIGGVGPVVAGAAGVRLYVFLEGTRRAPTFK